MENSFNKFVNTSITNTKSDLIEITEDKLENILLKHLRHVEKSRNWVTPTALAITTFIVLQTATFNDFLRIPKDVWHAIFIICCVTFICISANQIYNSIRYSKLANIESLIGRIKNKS